MDVNRAWDRLHTRLVDEQLFSQPAKTIAMPFIAKMKCAAAIVVLCVCGGAIGLYLNVKNESNLFVSIHNSDVSNTLVKTLEDGSVVYLVGGATLTCPERFADNKRQVSLQGDALFDVRSDTNCPFLIETEPVVVEVLGTTFNIKTANNNSFELSVKNGLVKVTLKTTGAHLFAATGETVRLNEHLQLSKEPQQFAHYAEKIRFKDERLENIIYVINKMSDKPICFSDNDLKNREITITFRNNTVAEMIELLCAALDLKYTENEKIYILGHPHH